MIKKILISIFISLLLTSINTRAQDTTKNDNIKTDWNFGLLPVITYNTDLGLQYGLLTNIYHYGKGDIYPSYYHSIYAEVSRYTKGSGIYRLFYDSKYLIKNIRTTFDLSYLPDQALDFYGFNGAQSVFNDVWQDDSHSDYKSRMYYKHKRNIARGKFDFQGSTKVNNLNWATGLILQNIEVATVDVDKLNKGKDDKDTLPHVNTLYDDYIDWGVIKDKESDGGFFTSLKAGIVYDSRDNEPNPQKGLWSEIVVAQTFNTDFTFTKLAITHRQYFKIIDNKLTFAYRVGYQGVIAGDIPFYALPTMVYSYLPSSNSDGLGGSKTVRGVVRNRIVGKGIIFGNLELRWKFTEFRFMKQNIYLALKPFMDFGQVVQEKEVDKTGIPTTINQSQYFNSGGDKIHISYGAGFHVAMNQNFIISADYGVPMATQDGDKGFYIGMNFLF